MSLIKSAVMVAVLALAPCMALAQDQKAPASRPACPYMQGQQATGDQAKACCPTKAEADKACCKKEEGCKKAEGCQKTEGCKKAEGCQKAEGCKKAEGCQKAEGCKDVAKAACKCEGECKCASGDKSACKCEAGKCTCDKKAEKKPVAGSCSKAKEQQAVVGK